MQPLVSVLLPVYNGEAYLRGAIESVLAQDYPNFEFVIADNASTDGTASIIADYSDDRRLRVIRNSETVPRLVNFNIVFTAADLKSRWFKFVGDDDRLLPGCLEEMGRAGEEHKSAGLVCSHYYNGGELVSGVLPPDVSLVEGPKILQRMLVDPGARSTIFSPASLLIKPGVYREMGGFRTDLLHADAELFYRILNRYDLAYVHRPLVQIGYHSASGQAESTAKGDTFREAYLIRYRNLKLYDRVKLKWTEVEKIKNNLVNDSFGFMLGRFLKGDLRGALQHLGAIPAAALYHVPLSALYFTALALKKIIRREPVRLFTGQKKAD